uniref:Evasin n=1 Tax=Rhipicephalus pulchellus TaxID=72859 RepID=L7MC72_RHIPC
MAHKIAIVLVSALCALHVLYAVCEGTEDEEYDYYDSATPMTCGLINSTRGMMVPPNCTVVCHNTTAYWNQTAPDNSTCFGSYNKTGSAQHVRYTCSVGHCKNGTCVTDNVNVDCW